MNTSEKCTLAVTLGDARGIGAEVAARALAGEDLRREMVPFVIGPRGVFGRALQLVGSPCAAWRTFTPSSVSKNISGFEELELALPVQSVDESGVAGTPTSEVRPGESTVTGEETAGYYAGQAVELAVKLAMTGLVKAVVTAPLDKRALNLGGYAHPGHTEMLKALTGVDAVAMMLVGGALRVTVATTHIPLHRVPKELSPALLVEKIRLTNVGLKTLFGVREPVIGLCALNPHAGEKGLLGDDEARLLEPAIAMASKEGIAVRGPMPSDTVFNACMAGDLDAVVALYHDQGMIPIKVHAFGKGVNLTLGLPFIRTSPDHGTALDIAWQGKADAGSMIEAITLAAKLSPLITPPKRC